MGQKRSAARRVTIRNQIFRVLLIAWALLVLPWTVRGQEGARPLVVVDVPFLAQTEDLCGGAAAAMVLRYWGAGDVQPEDFASLVDPKRRGISTGDLVQAITARGFLTRAVGAESQDMVREIARGRPVIALIDAGRGRLHYVVVVGWASGRVLFHDPSVGPFRVQSESEFRRLWKVTEGFALLVTPGTRPSPKAEAPPPTTSHGTSPCDQFIDQAILVARGADPEAAFPALAAATEMCPSEARALNALAGLRFRQERWKESAEFARRATKRDAKGPETWRLLGAARYLSDEPGLALLAWNRIGEPRLDRVLIEGLVRTRQDVATAVLGLNPRDVLTTSSMAMAERRLAQLPTAQNPKLTYRPLPGGRADLVASVGESDLIERWPFLFLRLGVEGVATREVRVRINSPTGRGEGIEIGGRFAAQRPALWVSLQTPRLAGLPGVVSLSGLWDRQTYRPENGPSGPVTIETRRRGAIEWSHWATASNRMDLGLAFDRFEGRGDYISVRGGSDARMARDHLAVLGDVASWIATSDSPGFSEFGGTLALRSSIRPRRWVFHARFDGRRATRNSPLAVWPGAGTGPGRTLLLRGSRLVRDGELVGDAFGRGLLHATLEAGVEVMNRDAARLGLAAFVDWARAWDTTLRPGSGPGIFSVGVGLRLRAFSTTALRIDVAKRPDRKGVVFSAAVVPPWPR